MNSWNIFKKTVTSPVELAGKTGEISFFALVPFYLAFTAADSLLKTVTPPDFIQEMSRTALRISEHGFVYYFSLFSVFNLLHALFFSLSFLVFEETAKSSALKAAGLFLLSLLVAVTALKAGGATNLLLASLIPVLLFFAFKKNSRGMYFLLKTFFSLYSLNLIFFPLLFLAVRNGHSDLYLVSEMFSGLWILAVFVKLAGERFSAAVPLVVISFIFASFNAILFFYLLKAAGIVSGEVFRIIAFT